MMYYEYIKLVTGFAPKDTEGEEAPSPFKFTRVSVMI